MAGRSHEGLRFLVADLCMIAPLGIGYAMSWQDAMGLDSDVAEFLVEEKRKLIDMVTRGRNE